MYSSYSSSFSVWRVTKSNSSRVVITSTPFLRITIHHDTHLEK